MERDLSSQVDRLESALAKAKDLFAGKVAALKLQHTQEVEELAKEIDALVAANDNQRAASKAKHEKETNSLKQKLAAVKARESKASAAHAAKLLELESAHASAIKAC